MHISLRPNEKIYINGAVLKVDRKVSIELMNDAVFLLEAHVMLEEKATTPLRKLYFIVQLMLMEPNDTDTKKIMFNLQGLSIAGHSRDPSILTGVAAVTELVNKGRAFEALKVIRSMLPIEDRLLETTTAQTMLPTLAVSNDAPLPSCAPGGSRALSGGYERLAAPMGRHAVA